MIIQCEIMSGNTHNCEESSLFWVSLMDLELEFYFTFFLNLDGSYIYRKFNSIQGKLFSTHYFNLTLISDLCVMLIQFLEPSQRPDN